MVRVISDAKRFKLYHGPYRAPKCRVGDWLACEYRGREVKVRGISDARIHWPTVRKTGRLCLIVCGDLARAVQVESERAVARHWGVRAETVSKWRRALDVPKWNEGSRRLQNLVSARPSSSAALPEAPSALRMQRRRTNRGRGPAMVFVSKG
jgi:hypothetical protein